ncbi:MAG: hypothetical protein K9M45_01005 [Kiritimatiellales bacterium]|nr:hypothetical protein [Kiritimatiellales bacterium]
MKLAALFIVATLVCGSAFGSFSGVDDFNDNSLDTEKWGPATPTELSEQNQRLEFVTDITPEERWDHIEWKPGEGGSYTNDWSAEVDVHLSGFDNSLWTNNLLGLRLLCSDSGSNEFSICYEIYAEDDDDGFESGQEIYCMIVTNRNFEDDSEEIWTDYSGDDVTLKLEYVAGSKTLSSYYDTGSGFTLLTNYNVTAWDMDDFDLFYVGLGVSVWSLDVETGQAYFDNFAATEANDSDELLVSIDQAVEIGWNSTSGLTYQVEYATALAPNDWNDLGDPVIAESSMTYVLDTIRDNPRKFYRVIVVE